MQKKFKKHIFKSKKTIEALIADNFRNAKEKIFNYCEKAGGICLITDSFCHKKFQEKINEIKKNGNSKTKVFVFPEGKEIKNFGSYVKLMEFLFKNGFGRNSLIIALGGGSVTDISGFAAATYMRGIDWISMPTTFLSQIDAGIGGKTAVNISHAKNMAGCFHQPVLTVCDISFLKYLSEGDKISGMGEFIKYLLIMPRKQSLCLKPLTGKLLALDKKSLLKAVCECVKFKMDIVLKDEKDKNGIREILNFGHTAGHAFEALSRGQLSHGAAIIWGMRFAYLLSIKLNILDKKHRNDVEKRLWELKLPALKNKCLNFTDFYNLVHNDKKTGMNQNKFILIKRPGTLKVKHNIDEKILKETLQILSEKM
ncbi:MAG: 3-dehydroquinate synthase [Elusimicrobia bacterium]|nr:3-dehydroquinate synthase [Elusimicrobiota bacterium]